MKRRLTLITACLFTLTLSPAQASTPLFTDSPIDQDVPICYMKTKHGSLIDLIQICGYIKPAACGTSLGSASRDAVLSEFCRKNQRCILTNTCDTMPRGINARPPGTPMGSLSQFKLWA